MTAKYLLEQAIIGPRLKIEIPEERYNEIAHARAVLLEALAFEQRYELLLGNFITMEMALAEIGLRAKLEFQFGYRELADNLEQANRHLVNFLTAMRGYADQIVQDFKCLRLEPAFGAVAKNALTQVFERSSDYRFMCGLRNHVQHKAAAVHGFEGDDEIKGDANSWVESVRFTALKSQLRSDKSFNAKILSEQPEKIDVRRCARRSIEELGVAHLALRELIEEQVARARSLIEAAIREYKDAGANSAIGLCARRIGTKAADVPVFLNWDDVRIELVRKNDRPARLWPRHAHTEPKVEDIVAARIEAGHTPAQAAKAVFVSTTRWQDYEEGLPMPQGLFLLYRLQTMRHPTHTLQLLDKGGQVRLGLKKVGEGE